MDRYGVSRADRLKLIRADDICPYEFYRTFVQHRRGGYYPPVVSLGAPIDPLREITTRGRIATGALRPRNDKGSHWRADDICPYVIFARFPLAS